jgi:hypothetical protein
MLRNVLVIVLMLVLFGIVGHFDYEDSVKTAEYDRQNKQEVIKDLQLRCYTGDLQGDICKGF